MDPLRQAIEDSHASLRLFQELLPDRVRAPGPDHPYTLTTRGNIVFWTGQVREPWR